MRNSLNHVSNKGRETLSKPPTIPPNKTQLTNQRAFPRVSSLWLAFTLAYLVASLPAFVNAKCALPDDSFGNIMMRTSNFSDNTLNASYDAFWDNLATAGTSVILVTNTTTGLNYSTIQEAVDAALSGHVLQVAAGAYAETVTINKSLEIRGANAGVSGCATRSTESVLQGSFIISSNNVTIDGFELTGIGAQIRSSGANSTWSNITIQNNYIHATTAQLPVLHGFGNGGGIGTQNWIVSNNKIEDILAADATSIALFNITNLMIADNCITHANASFNGRRGINLDGCQNVMFDGNTVNMGLVSPASDNSDGAFTKARYQLQLSASFQSVLNVTVTENNLGGAYDGIITLGNGNYSGISITKNTISDNVIGVRFQAGTNVPTGAHSNFTITNNDISTSNRSIYLQDGAASGGTADIYSGILINNNSLVRSTTGVALEVQSTALISGGPINATCNWYGSSDPTVVATRVSGALITDPFLTDGTDNDGGTPGFQPAPGSCGGCTEKPTVSFNIGGSSVASINNGLADLSESTTVAVCNGGTYTLANMLHSNGTSSYNIAVTPSGGGLLFNGTPASNGNISAAQFTLAQGLYTITLSNPAQGGSVVQVITPYIDADNSGGLSTGDCSGDPITITYIATTPPTVECVNYTVTFNGENAIVLNAADLVSASDACGEVTFELSPSSISCDQIGQVVPVTVTATDINGNQSICTSQVTVTGMPCGFSEEPNGVNCGNGNNVSYNPGTGVWTATSVNCYYTSPYTSDQMAFAQRTLCGDGSITAQVTSITGTALGWAGVMMRENNDAGAKKAQLMTNLSFHSRREFRTTTNGQAFPQQFPSQNRYWLRLVRTGSQFNMYISLNGQTWSLAGTQTISMTSCIEIGLVVTNYKPSSTVTATFANVTFTGGNNTLLAGTGTGADVRANNYLPQPDFTVFPNPTSGEVIVDLSAYADKSVILNVYDVQGKVLKTIEVDVAETATQQLDLSIYKDGIYLIRVHAVGAENVLPVRPDATKRVVVNSGN